MIDLVSVIQENISFFRQGYYEKSDGTKEFFGVRCAVATSISTVPNWVRPSNRDVPVEVVNLDTLVAAEQYVRRGYQVCALNMASNWVPGGGVLKGSRAQEEELCRRSDLLADIGRYDERVSKILGVELEQQYYPLEDSYLYSYNRVFRKPDTYELMDNPFGVDIITAAAVKDPVLGDQGYMEGEDLEYTRNLIYTILSADYRPGMVLILGALGCGAYHNNPYQIAGLFKENMCYLNENVEKVVFAILDKKKSDNNLKPFKDVFS